MKDGVRDSVMMMMMGMIALTAHTYTHVHRLTRHKVSCFPLSDHFIPSSCNIRVRHNILHAILSVLVNLLTRIHKQQEFQTQVLQ